MAKVAITGHTRGIGLAIAEEFRANGHTVVGFSRGNGFDIADSFDRQLIVDRVSDCDIFVNNAYSAFAQCDLLLTLHNAWKGQKKTIVNVSSGYVMRGENSTKDPIYRSVKIALEDASQVLWTRSPWPSIMVVRPCLTDTEMVAHIDATNKVDPKSFARVLYYNLMQTDFRVQVLGLAVNPQ